MALDSTSLLKFESGSPQLQDKMKVDQVSLAMMSSPISLEHKQTLEETDQLHRSIKKHKRDGDDDQDAMDTASPIDSRKGSFTT